MAERRRTEGGVGEEREEGSGEMQTYCTKAAVSGTSLYGSRPRPRVSARPEGEERRWSPKPDTGEREGCGCIGTPGVTIAGTSLYGSRPHPQGAELWSAEHREGGRLLRRSSVRGDLGKGIPEGNGSQSQEYDQGSVKVGRLGSAAPSTQQAKGWAGGGKKIGPSLCSVLQDRLGVPGRPSVLPSTLLPAVLYVPNTEMKTPPKREASGAADLMDPGQQSHATTADRR
ncbi:hypothetical protein DFH06DRAFT_1147120 [Mycena polygramma]|nr:hypothetical protein DFH06DRAFT_1147120 [Mycena polygramma]